MNRFFLLAPLWCLLHFTSYSQVVLCNQVVATTGKSVTNGNRTFSYTVGQPVINTVGNFGLRFTQGFQQPDPCSLVSTKNDDLKEWNIEVYPNPADQYFQIRYDANRSAHLVLSVMDLLGRIVLSEIPAAQSDGFTIDCHNWQPGVYMLMLHASDSPSSTSVPIVKL